MTTKQSTRVDACALERLMFEQGIGKKALASKADITIRQLNRLLAGQNTSSTTIASIARVLRVGIAEIAPKAAGDVQTPIALPATQSAVMLDELQFRTPLSRMLALYPRDFAGDVFDASTPSATSRRYCEPAVLQRRPDGVFASTALPEVCESKRCWTLLGGPGTGKSLWLVHVARHYLSTESPYTPLLVPLSSWSRQTSPSLGHWIASNPAFQEFVALTHSGVVADAATCDEFILRWRRTGKLLLLLDGWDELSPQTQQHIRDRLAMWVNPGVPAACSIIVASREGFPSVLPAFEGNQLRLEALDTLRQRRRFYELYIHDKARVDELSRSVESHAELSVLKRNPFFLSLIAWLTGSPASDVGRQLLAPPFHLVQLYERAVEALFLARRRRDAEASTEVFEINTWFALLSHFAWTSLSLHGREPLATTVAVELLHEVAAAESPKTPDLRGISDRTCRQALEALEDSRILMALFDTRQWLHSSVHEFLAARYLASEHFDPDARRRLGLSLRPSLDADIKRRRFALLKEIAESRVWSENLVLAFDLALQMMDRVSEDALLDVALQHWRKDMPSADAPKAAQPGRRAAVLLIEGRAAFERDILDRRLRPEIQWVNVPRGIKFWTSRGDARRKLAGVSTVHQEIAAQRWHTTVGEYKHFVDNWAAVGGWRGLKTRLGARLSVVLAHLTAAEQEELFSRTDRIAGAREYPSGRVDQWLDELSAMDPKEHNQELLKRDVVWAKKWEAMTQAERDAQEKDTYERARGQYCGYQDWATQLRTSWNCPVVNVTWWDAVAYCAWMNLGVDEDYVVRLPFAYEWEAAARLLGFEGEIDRTATRQPAPERDYPGRQALVPDRYHARGSGLERPAPVGSYEVNPTSDIAVWDLVGNAWCWTASQFDAADASLHGARACCGASWNDLPPDLRISHPGRYGADSWYMIFGLRPFRIALH